MSREPNYYRILGISPLVSKVEIKHAYRALAKQYHPDAVPQERREWARAQMTRINAAYRILCDPQKRAMYDRQRGYAQIKNVDPPPSVETRVPSAPSSPRWHRRRVRERLRREHIERWKAVVIGSSILLAIGILLTACFARSWPAYLASILINGSALILVLSGLIAINR